MTATGGAGAPPDVVTAQVAAVVGGAIVIAADPGARIIASALRRARGEARRNGLAFDGVLASLLAVAELAESQVAARTTRQVAAPVAAVEPSGCVPAQSEVDRHLGTSDVARLASVSEQAVRKAAARGRLVGQRTATGWQFTESAAARWQATRTTDDAKAATR